MHIEAVERTTPHGFRDAFLASLGVDYETKTAQLVLDLDAAEVVDGVRVEATRRCTLLLSGVEFFSMMPTATDSTEASALTASGFAGLPPEGALSMPPVPDGLFAYSFFVELWNSFVVVYAADAELRWGANSEHSIDRVKP